MKPDAMSPDQALAVPPTAPDSAPVLPADQGAGASLLAAAIRRHAEKALVSLGLAKADPDRARHTCDIGCAAAIKVELMASAISGTPEP